MSVTLPFMVPESRREAREHRTPTGTPSFTDVISATSVCVDVMAVRRCAGLALLLPIALLCCTGVATAARHVLEKGK